jgi:hypothetical protein
VYTTFVGTGRQSVYTEHLKSKLITEHLVLYTLKSFRNY